MKIRNIKYSDVDKVKKLLISSFSSRYNKPLISKNFSDSKNITLVAEINDEIVGIASLHIIKKLTRKMGLIEDVAVNPDQRGNGIGKKLIENLSDESSTIKELIMLHMVVLNHLIRERLDL